MQWVLCFQDLATERVKEKRGNMFENWEKTGRRIKKKGDGNEIKMEEN